MAAGCCHDCNDMLGSKMLMLLQPTTHICVKRWLQAHFLKCSLQTRLPATLQDRHLLQGSHFRNLDQLFNSVCFPLQSVPGYAFTANLHPTQRKIQAGTRALRKLRQCSNSAARCIPATLFRSASLQQMVVKRSFLFLPLQVALETMTCHGQQL